MIEPDADREALRDRLRRALWSEASSMQETRRAETQADAVLDADDLLVTDLRCPTCKGKGVLLDPDSVGRAFAAVLDKGKGAGVEHLRCPTCHGTGRIEKRVVDADLLRRYVAATTTDDSDAFTDAEWEQIEGWRR